MNTTNGEGRKEKICPNGYHAKGECTCGEKFPAPSSVESFEEQINDSPGKKAADRIANQLADNRALAVHPMYTPPTQERKTGGVEAIKQAYIKAFKERYDGILPPEGAEAAAEWHWDFFWEYAASLTPPQTAPDYTIERLCDELAKLGVFWVDEEGKSWNVGNNIPACDLLETLQTAPVESKWKTSERRAALFKAAEECAPIFDRGEREKEDSTAPVDVEEEKLAWMIADTINEILAYRGIHDQGKNFREDVEERIIPLIRRLRSLNTGGVDVEELLKRISAMDYQSSDELRNESEAKYGLDYEEALEMAYDNMQGDVQALRKEGGRIRTLLSPEGKGK